MPMRAIVIPALETIPPTASPIGSTRWRVSTPIGCSRSTGCTNTSTVQEPQTTQSKGRSWGLLVSKDGGPLTVDRRGRGGEIRRFAWKRRGIFGRFASRCRRLREAGLRYSRFLTFDHAKALPLLTSRSATTRNLTHAFLLRAGELLHQYGTPAYRLERVLAQTAARIGVEGTFIYMSTALLASIREGGEEWTYLRRVESGEIDISKLLRFDAILEDIELKRITVIEALRQLEAAADASAPFGFLTRL